MIYECAQPTSELPNADGIDVSRNLYCSLSATYLIYLISF